jgi:hypothetical protein
VVAFVLMLTIFIILRQKLFVWQVFLQQQKSFCLRMMKDRQHHNKDTPHIQKKSQDSATSMEDAITDRVHTIGVETS